jgi:hypothetical protein
MATYSMVIAVLLPKPVLATRGMVGEPNKIDTKLSLHRIYGQGGKLNIAAELITNEELTETPNPRWRNRAMLHIAPPR